MEQYALYLALKLICQGINSTYRYTFNDMDFNKSNVCGIYIKGGEPSEYREIATGVYYNYSARVQFLIQGGLGNDSLMELLKLAGNIRNTLIQASNKVYNAAGQVKLVDGAVLYDKDGDIEGEDVYVRLSLVALMGETDFKGKSSQGLPIYSLNLRVYYSIEGGNG